MRALARDQLPGAALVMLAEHRERRACCPRKAIEEDRGDGQQREQSKSRRSDSACCEAGEFVTHARESSRTCLPPTETDGTEALQRSATAFPRFLIAFSQLIWTVASIKRRNNVDARPLATFLVIAAALSPGEGAHVPLNAARASSFARVPKCLQRAHGDLYSPRMEERGPWAKAEVAPTAFRRAPSPGPLVTLAFLIHIQPGAGSEPDRQPGAPVQPVCTPPSSPRALPRPFDLDSLITPPANDSLARRVAHTAPGAVQPRTHAATTVLHALTPATRPANALDAVSVLASSSRDASAETLFDRRLPRAQLTFGCIGHAKTSPDYAPPLARCSDALRQRRPSLPRHRQVPRHTGWSASAPSRTSSRLRRPTCSRSPFQARLRRPRSTTRSSSTRRQETHNSRLLRASTRRPAWPALHRPRRRSAHSARRSRRVLSGECPSRTRDLLQAGDQA